MIADGRCETGQRCVGRTRQSMVLERKEKELKENPHRLWLQRTSVRAHAQDLVGGLAFGLVLWLHLGLNVVFVVARFLKGMAGEDSHGVGEALWDFVE